jgi:hypothetical protein
LFLFFPHPSNLIIGSAPTRVYPSSRFSAKILEGSGGQEPRYSTVGTARWHHLPGSSIQNAPVPRTTTHAGSKHGALHGSTGRRVESLNPANPSRIRHEAQEALQASPGSVRGSESLPGAFLRSLEAFPGQGQTAEVQFRPLPMPRCSIPRTTHGTSSGFMENRGTGVDFPSPSTL